MRPALFPLVLALGATACHRTPAPAAAGGADAGAAPALPTVRVDAKADHYLFSWYGADGKIHDAQKLDEIPTAARKQILVRDLARRPEELKSDRFLFIADLSTPASDDGWPTTVVSRYAFEAQDDAQLPTAGGEAADDDGGAPLVTIYGTSWCGACRAAREHLKARRVSFADKDIEKDPAAAKELERKARRAGLRLGGVPVLDVGGHLMMGFDAAEVDRLIDDLEKKI